MIPMWKAEFRMRNTVLVLAFSLFIGAALLMVSGIAVAAEDTLSLQTLIDEALKNNRDVRAAESRWSASTYRIPQAESLPDPMITVGYQNEGWSKYTYGQMQGSQWMYSASQTFPFPGKRSLKGEAAANDAGSIEASYKTVRLRTVATVKELYYDLFLTYKNLDIVTGKTALFSRIEDAALARYASGKTSQQEVLMAQTEKYMLLEKETMLSQKKQSLEAMLTSVLGRDTKTMLGRPSEPSQSPFPYSLEELLALASEHSPDIRSKEKMKSSSQAQISLAQKEYYPDLTLAGSVYQRKGDFEDMWSLTATINIPIFFGKKRAAVAEARSLSHQAESELEGTKLQLVASIQDSYSMLQTTDKLMSLYKAGLIPKTEQDFQLALSGYAAGKIEAITVISRLKALLDYETLFWGQFVEREKTIARLEAIAGIENLGTPVKSHD
jgi:outer membrane protein TolC